MKIIPAIDLYNKQAVRLFKGDYNQVTVYSDKPWELVSQFERDGAKRIHLVDLNGARGEIQINQEIIQKIKEHCSVKLQLGGGIRSLETLEYYFNLGIDYCIIGTKALTDPNFLETALEKFSRERIIVGVDILNDEVRISGWEKNSGILWTNFLNYLKKINVKTIVLTDISKDGTLTGPNFDLYAEVLDMFSFDVIASGGFSTEQDLARFSNLKSQNQIFGSILGKSIYEKSINLQKAIRKFEIN